MFENTDLQASEPRCAGSVTRSAMPRAHGLPSGESADDQAITAPTREPSGATTLWRPSATGQGSLSLSSMPLAGSLLNVENPAIPQRWGE